MALSSELQHLNALLEDEQTADDQNKLQYLTFSLGEEEYGVDILRVQEIRSWVNVTPIPNTPDYLCGLLNLRGAIIPIVDLRLKFRMTKRSYSPVTVVIVLKVQSEHNDRTKRVGVVVDAVSDAYGISTEAIKPSPDFGEQINTSYITGLAAIDDKMMMILDVDLLLSLEALA